MLPPHLRILFCWANDEKLWIDGIKFKKNESDKNSFELEELLVEDEGSVLTGLFNQEQETIDNLHMVAQGSQINLKQLEVDEEYYLDTLFETDLDDEDEQNIHNCLDLDDYCLNKISLSKAPLGFPSLRCVIVISHLYI